MLRTRLMQLSATNARFTFRPGTRTLCVASKLNTIIGPGGRPPYHPPRPEINRISAIIPAFSLPRRNQSAAATIRATEDICEDSATIITASSTTSPVYVPEFPNLAERLVADFKVASVSLTQYGIETLKKLYGDLPDQSITRDVVATMEYRLREFEKARKARGETEIKMWVPANEPETCGARAHTDSLRILKTQPRGMWEVLKQDIQEYCYDPWSMKVYWLLVDLIKADIIQRRDLMEYHGDPEDEHLWGPSMVKWRRLL
ncbi:hypothetical protein ABW20_dc0101325 [Dactylellina cionopaga]|nr:hypothetical protein ABW20_dc0101325 [Dactylellina cionopaga]